MKDDYAAKPFPGSQAIRTQDRLRTKLVRGAWLLAGSAWISFVMFLFMIEFFNQF